MGTILVANLLLVWLFFKELAGHLRSRPRRRARPRPSGDPLWADDIRLDHRRRRVRRGRLDFVVALMIGPPAAAYLLTDDLKRMLGLSMAIGALSAVAGYWVAHWLDASIAGAMASMVGWSSLACWCCRRNAV